MLNVLSLNFHIASFILNFILFLVCTAINNILWMDRFINVFVIIIIINKNLDKKNNVKICIIEI